jgi:hypothetical protein
VRAQIDGPAEATTTLLNAEAYASGSRIAFGKAPDLHTAAHETAHIIQQRGGVQLSNGIGKAGDAHERHADSVAERVVRGESAESLLAEYGGAHGSSHHRSERRPEHTGIASAAPVQFIGDPLKPGDKMRTFTVDEYLKKWEKAYGRKMTPIERKTLARGCIGITAVNLGLGNINPPLKNSFDSFAHAKHEADRLDRDLKKHKKNGQLKAYIYSQRFYSKGKAYKPDPKTGRVDMSGYKYEAKPGYVNFDYGWYDDQSNTWWHANHSEPGMKVYQSTLANYSRPLQDFDRQVFCVSVGKKHL